MNTGELSRKQSWLEEQSTQGKEKMQESKKRETILKGWFIRKLRWGNKGQGKQSEGRTDKACHGAQVGRQTWSKQWELCWEPGGLSRSGVGGVGEGIFQEKQQH